MAQLLDGKVMSAKVKAEVRAQVDGMSEKPGLAVIIVGENPASKVYVRGKIRDCAECGIVSEEYALPADTDMDTLLKLIGELNVRPGIDGILCQLPLPAGLDEEQVLLAIDPGKDVDCFHPYNVGRLLIGNETFLPCTPAGVMRMLEEAGIDPDGKRCVVIGRSNIVGKPMCLLLQKAGGTVTCCHSHTRNLKELTLQADILVSAVGKLGTVTADMVKEGAVVIDVAINRNEAGKLCGDADFGPVSEKAGWITPVPGGCGLMTRAMLMVNALTAARLHGKR